MFANTLIFAVGGVNKTLTRVRENAGSSIYRLREATGTYTVTIKQTSYIDGKRGGVNVERRTVEMVHTIFPVAPATVSEIRKSYTVIENDASTADITLTRNVSKAVADFVGLAANADMLLIGEY